MEISFMITPFSSLNCSSSVNTPMHKVSTVSKLADINVMTSLTGVLPALVL